jgi:hypothetical protein
VRAVLGAFAVTRARERCGDLDAALNSAVSHYERRLASEGDSPPTPPELAAALDPPLLEVEVELSAAGAAALEVESRRLGVGVHLLLNHAVLLYLADLDRHARRRECGGRKCGHPTLDG